MKMIKAKLAGTVIAVQSVLLGSVMAHPGPPGHTHGDEWPFGMIALGVAALGLVIATGIVRQKKRRIR